MRIMLDTNMLLAPFQFKAQVYADGNEYFTLDKCLAELEEMAERRTKEGLVARAAILLAQTKGVDILPAGKKKPDDALLERAREGFTVATNDKQLIKRIKLEGYTVLRLKKKKFLEEE